MVLRPCKIHELRINNLLNYRKSTLDGEVFQEIVSSVLLQIFRQEKYNRDTNITEK